MYGTVARLQLKPDMEANLKEEMAKYPGLEIPGFVSTILCRMDRNANDCYLAVAFKDKESYHANARDPKKNLTKTVAFGRLPQLRTGIRDRNKLPADVVVSHNLADTLEEILLEDIRLERRA